MNTALEICLDTLALVAAAICEEGDRLTSRAIYDLYHKVDRASEKLETAERAYNDALGELENFFEVMGEVEIIVYSTFGPGGERWRPYASRREALRREKNPTIREEVVKIKELIKLFEEEAQWGLFFYAYTLYAIRSLSDRIAKN